MSFSTTTDVTLRSLSFNCSPCSFCKRSCNRPFLRLPKRSPNLLPFKSKMTMFGHYSSIDGKDYSTTNIFQSIGSDDFDDDGNLWDVVLEFSTFRSVEVYSLAISCFGNVGEFQLMEQTLQEMVANGFRVDSLTANSILEYCSKFGSLADMENAYRQMKKSRILIEKQGIRAVASAYIRGRKYYQLGQFLRDVGLARRNTGNLLWNLLLLSYAVNFKMKSLQREFLRMVDAGFSPDINTFNIRALAFSRMSMFWDLHLSIEHMNHVGIIPDVVTHGCIIDAYMERKLGRNLMDFGLKEFNMNQNPQVETDGLVFEAFGKGDFHSFFESLMQSKWEQNWTYAKMIRVYCKKMYRSNQIFWNC